MSCFNLVMTSSYSLGVLVKSDITVFFVSDDFVAIWEYVVPISTGEPNAVGGSGSKNSVSSMDCFLYEAIELFSKKDAKESLVPVVPSSLSISSYLILLVTRGLNLVWLTLGRRDSWMKSSYML